MACYWRKFKGKKRGRYQMEFTRHPYNAPTIHQDIIHHVAFDHQGRRLATCSSDTTLAVWDRESDGSWKRAAFWKVHGGAVFKVRWAHPEFGQVLATCSFDRSVNIWAEQYVRLPAVDEDGDDVLGGREKQWIRRANLTESRASVTDIAFAPRYLGLMLAAVSAQGTVRVYEAPDSLDVSHWSLIHELQAFYTRCGAVTWSQSRIHRPLIAVGSDDKRSEPGERIVIYEYTEATRKWSRIVAAHFKFDLHSPVSDLQFSAIALVHSHQLAIAAGDVHLFNLKVARTAILDDDPEHRNEFEGVNTEYSCHRIALLGDVRKAWRLRYNATGTAISATSRDGTFRVWKSMFNNQWVLLSEMLAEDYMVEEEVAVPTEGKSEQKAPQVYY